MPDSTSTGRRCDEERERISPSPSPLFRSLFLWTCSSPPHLCLNLSFYPTLKLHRHTSVLLFQYLLLNLYSSLYSAHAVPLLLRHVFFFFFLFLRSHFTLPPQVCRFASIRMQWGLCGLRVLSKTGAEMSKNSFHVSRHGCWPSAGKSIFSYFLIVKWCFKDEFV